MSEPIISASKDVGATWRVSASADGLTGLGYGRSEAEARTRALASLAGQQRFEVIAVAARQRGECPQCAYQRETKDPGPSHNGSSHCESGSLASGGTRSHCTCDFCF
jgi:hypothetical protein